MTVMERAAEAAADLRWRDAYDLLRREDLADLDPDALALYADAAWWCCKVSKELELRQQAYAGFVAAGQPRRAAYAAWMLSVRYGLRGDPAQSSGWLQRAQRQLVGEPDCVEKGYLACGEIERSLGAGDVAEGLRLAQLATAIGERFHAPDLVALAISWQGLCRLADNEVTDGLRLLDEAMASVNAHELDSHFTGWVACFAVGMCMGVADLRRAGTWAQAAWDWESTLPQDTPYRGLCRVRQVEVMSLRGQLDTAAPEAERACEEMLAFEPHLAGEAFYVLGEIRRRRGEIGQAERAFRQARELGHDPQPGVARIRLTQGHPTVAATALRAALTDEGKPVFTRASLLAAQVEVAIACDDLETARAARDTLAESTSQVPSEALRALAATTDARVRLVEGDAEGALAQLRPAAAIWRALEMAYDVAQTHVLTGLALRELGDHEGADFELESGLRTFRRIGASADAAELDAQAAAAEPAPGGLTQRECQVLRLVAAGHSNREIAAELVLSEHTVARHLSNIFGKLGVSSRTAAAARLSGIT